MPGYEYMQMATPTIKELNKHAAEGWRLIGAELLRGAVLERPLPTQPDTMRVADIPHEDGDYLIFYIDSIGCTAKVGYVFPDYADELRAAFAEKRTA